MWTLTDILVFGSCGILLALYLHWTKPWKELLLMAYMTLAFFGFVIMGWWVLVILIPVVILWLNNEWVNITEKAGVKYVKGVGFRPDIEE